MADETHDSDQDQDPLDAGLRAAFSGSSDAMTTCGVLATLDESLSGRPPVLLRDAPDETDPMVKPTARGQSPLTDPNPRYQVIGEIARGGVGVIMKSRDVDLGRDVAMKVLRSDHAGRSDMLQRFVEEAQIAGQLQHPGILPVYELGLLNEQTPYFTMKLVKGQTLSVLLSERDHPGASRARFIGQFEHVCQTLAYAHAKGVIHRDLKPSNILVGAFGEVQVVDWGLAKVLARGGLADEAKSLRPEQDKSVVSTVRSSSKTSQSLVGSVMGTPAYMPPEQARGDLDLVTERSDVFALGAILCEILTGEPPYSGAEAGPLESAQKGDLQAAYQRLEQTTEDPELAGLARECLSVEPSDRPRSASEVAAAISRYVTSTDQRARDLELVAARAEGKAKAERRARRLTIVFAFTVIAAIVAIMGTIHLRQQKHSGAVNIAIEEASQQLGRATAAPVGEIEDWLQARVASERLAQLLDDSGVDTATHQRATAFLSRFARAEADRLITERIEEVVITGATHHDPESWKWMERSLREAFADYGIDILELSNEETAKAIRASDLSTQLADGYELWLATSGHLHSMGVSLYSIAEIKRRTEVLNLADPDPITQRIRELLYAPQPTSEQVRELASRVDIETTRPRTLSWLGSVCFRTGDTDILDEVLGQALLRYPGDFMLNFDYAFMTQSLGRWEESIRYYMRCIAIRPKSAGIWRCLGTAYRELEDLQGSLEALERSVELDQHAPTYVDLAKTQLALGEDAEATASLRHALDLNSNVLQARELLEKLETGKDSK